MLPAPASLEELLAQSSWLRGLAASLVRDVASAEDVVQETWLRALRRPPQAGESPRPWLARVARNLASNLRRTEKRRERREAAFRGTDPELDPSVIVEEVEAQRVLAEAVLRLEEPLRTAVILRYVRGLDSKEIGRLQGAPAGTVRWRLKRALELLRADLDRRFGERSRWCSAFAVLVRDGAGGGLTASAPVASSSVIAVAGVLAAATLLALSGAWSVASGALPRATELARTVEVRDPRVVDEDHTELVSPEQVDEPAGTEEGSRVRFLPDTGAEGDGTRRRSRIHGQLRMDESGEVLDEALTVLLRMGDMSVKDTVVTAADGSFTSRKAFPRGNVLAEVRRPAGDTAVEYEDQFDPSSDEEWNVYVPWPTFVGGRLVDPRGEPLEKCWIELLQGGIPMERYEATERRNAGCFAFSGLSPGSCTVIVRRELERHEFSVAVSRGPNELGDVLVPFCERGPVSGHLRWPPGIASPATWRKQPGGVLVLEEVASGVTYEALAAGSDLPGMSAFEFEDVPVSDCRLTLFPEDGLRYAAPARIVRPPVTDIEFEATGEADPLDFRVIDGPGGQQIEAWSAWALSRGRWNWVPRAHWPVGWHPVVQGSLEAADVERWILVARDHRPASGGTLESAQVDVRLEPGWSCALFFTEEAKDSGRLRKGPLAGVEVRADGVVVARSDGDGLALVSLARRPGKIACALPGWVDANDGDLTYDAGKGICWDVYMRRE